MSIINDALKKTQLKFKKPKKKENAQVQEDPKPKEDAVVNVYEKMYKDRESNAKPSSTHIISEKELPKSGQAPRRTNEWLKTAFAAIFLVTSIFFSFKFLSGYEPLGDFIRSKTGKVRSSRFHITKHVPKKRAYKPGDLVLNGISTIDGKRVALINDEIYRVGEIVNNKTITNIGHDTVELRDDEEIITIKVR